MIKVTNGSLSTLAAGVSASDTTVTLATGTGTLFPTYSTIYPSTGYDYSYAVIEDASHNFEIVKLINRAADALTIQRAQEGTTALAFAAGAAFEIRPTAQTVIDLATSAGSTSSQTHAATTKASPAAADEIPIVDSANGNALAKLTWAALRTAFSSAVLVWSAPQKTTVTADNDLSFDLSTGMDFTCTPTGSGTLGFTNIAAGQRFEILFVNSANYAIAKGSNIKCPSSLFTTISATGRYIIAGRCLDGTNVDLTVSGALS